MKKEKTTIENKERKVNENLMFNFKNVSLMKKQLFSLMMAFALVLGLSVSAWAQTQPVNITAAEGTIGNPKIFIAAATSTLSVTEEAGHTYTWNLYSGTAAGTGVTLVDVGTDAMASGLNINATTGTPITFPYTGASVTFTWTEAASGNFYATVTDLNTTTNCSTVRSYHMFLMGYQIIVYASDATGLQLSGTGLQGCGDGTTYPAFLNNVALNAAGDDIRDDIMNTAGTPAPIDGSLSNVRGTNPRTTKYFTAALIFDTPPSGSFGGGTGTIPVGSARMDITIDGTTMPASDVYSINSTVILEADRSTPQSLVLPLASNPGTLPAAVSEQNGLAAGAHAHYYFTFPIVVNDRWGIDLTPQAIIRNTRIYTANTGLGTVLGQEPVVRETAENTSAEYTIYGKPATSIITGN